ncbi:MAG: periplasmic heavy metal sensor [Desulfobacteraceae bacterium]|nr:MAG: periplasmic heavy metal sensor [Desulfobacteraceae bacterium]
MMSNQRKIMLGIVCCTFLFLSETLAMDGNFIPPGHPGEGGQLMDAIRSLGLSDSRKTAISTIISNYQGEMTTYMDTIPELKKEMVLSVFSEEPDEEKIRQYCRDISANIEELELLKMKMLVEIKAVLYPEQVKQLQAELTGKLNFLEKQRDHRDEMMKECLE